MRDWRPLLGAAFLMATSAVGPGFLTQTAVFTQQLGASFGFVILMSILLDIGAQMNVWRIIAAAEKRGQEIANLVLPGLGYVVAGLIVMGGLAFNIGNIAGCGLAFNVLLGWAPETGAVASAAIVIAIFLVREAGKTIDLFAQVMGVVMIGLATYVAFAASPPVGDALARTFVPETLAIMPIVTLVGGTVGGYITFAGGHRLLDAGIKGPGSLPQVTRSAAAGILIASTMRIVLFLGALGVVAAGLVLDPQNPPASVFRFAAGEVGYRLFGVVLWAGAITSVIGSAYTSVSFIRTFHAGLDKHHRWLIVGFVLLSTAMFVWYGRPIKVLILAGALNGLILPITLGTMLVAAHQPKIVGSYRHPLWLTVFGAGVVVAMSWLGGHAILHEIPKLFRSG